MDVPHSRVDAAETGGNAARMSRRDALRKAAGGAVVAGAVWSAPKVQGLSLVPDYAAAATGTVGALTLALDARDGCSIEPLADQMGANSGGGWTVNSANTSAGPASVIATAPLPGVGNPNATVTATLPGPAPNSGDRNAAYVIDVTFSGIDPPFNNCRVSAAPFDDCIAVDTDAMVIGSQPYNTAPASARNPLSSFPVSVTLPANPTDNFGNGQIIVRCD